MNIILISSCLFILFLSSVSCEEYYELVHTQWESFKHQYSKYYTTEMEEKFRFKIFLDNYRKVIEHNAQYANNETTFTVSINKFTDMLSHEINGIGNGIKNTKINFDDIANDAIKDDLNLFSTIYVPVPESINWVTKGAVTGVKDQKSCSSDWAFSSTGSLEGQLFRTTGKLISLSEQNLIDCSKKDNGCRGGNTWTAFDYITRNNGIDTEESYPYKSKEENCHYNKTTRGAGTVGYGLVSQNNEKILMQTVAKIGPISVYIDSSRESFNSYLSGVYYDVKCSNNPNNVNHAVLIVGYGKDKATGMDYWLVKNSWGTTWGDGGYIKIARNMNNNCCIACFPVYPIIARF